LQGCPITGPAPAAAGPESCNAISISAAAAAESSTDAEVSGIIGR
jgi:hypothetical protein